MSKTGHAFIKERMREEDAVYGGEMSAHHYFRDFAYCDSGMIPWLLVTELLSVKSVSLSDLVSARMNAFPCSGELNYKVTNAKDTIRVVEEHYSCEAKAIDKTDGLSVEFDDWRFNIRVSNTEPLLRLNVEARDEESKIEGYVTSLESFIRGE
jgi:phosphomannomutase